MRTSPMGPPKRLWHILGTAAHRQMVIQKFNTFSLVSTPKGQLGVNCTWCLTFSIGAMTAHLPVRGVAQRQQMLIRLI